MYEITASPRTIFLKKYENGTPLNDDCGVDSTIEPGNDSKNCIWVNPFTPPAPPPIVIVRPDRTIQEIAECTDSPIP